MEPVTIIAAISAMMAAIGVWQKERDYNSTKAEYSRVFEESLRSDEIQREANFVASLLPQNTLDLLGERVDQCWEDFDAKIDPKRGDISNPRDAEPELELCVCEELRSIKRLNGTVPEGKLRNWWNNYGCGPYIA
ncbi:MAG: hypothetical protein ACE37D_21265 [Pseudomonadales bacterium]